MGFAAIPTVLAWRQRFRTKLVLAEAISKFFALLWLWWCCLEAKGGFCGVLGVSGLLITADSWLGINSHTLR